MHCASLTLLAGWRTETSRHMFVKNSRRARRSGCGSAAAAGKNALSGDWLVQELELKVELSKPDLDRLAGECVAADLSIGPAATKELRTVYFETPEPGFHAAGGSLRLRRPAGGWGQAVKGGA